MTAVQSEQGQLAEPNVLLIVMDAVNRDACSVYNDNLETTPFLNSWSKNAEVYTEARAPACFTLPSHASMFTGLSVDEHDVRRYRDRLQDGHSIYEWLSSGQGYTTGMFSTNGFLTNDSYGLVSGFEDVHEVYRPFYDALHPVDMSLVNSENVYLTYLKGSLRHQKPVRSLVNGFSNFISDDETDKKLANEFLNWQSATSAPWGACINFADAHFPYHSTKSDLHSEVQEMQSEIENLPYEYYCGRVDDDELEKFRDLYHSAVSSVDRAIRQLITGLKKRGDHDNTLIIITADHGEGFGEEPAVGDGTSIVAHRGGVHESLFHIPLLVKSVGQSDGQTQRSLASLTSFHNVVKKAIVGEDISGSFLSDEVAVSVNHPRGERELDLARDYCGDTEKFYQYKRAVYRQDGDTIIKHMSTDGGKMHQPTQRSVRIDGSRVERVDDDAGEIIDEVFCGLEKLTVRSSADNVSEETKNRLRELGYR